MPTSTPVLVKPGYEQQITVATMLALKARKTVRDNLAAYQYNPTGYLVDKLGWTPWSGDDERPGQQQVIDAYILALHQQHERDAYEQGYVSDRDLQWWHPGQVIQNRLRIEAGHTIGKTKLSSGLVNHFFDTFTPSIIYTFAPTGEQIHDLLWKELKSDRADKGLPGRISDLALWVAPDHFAKGRATNDQGGAGSERIQGQHGKYLMFVLDEAEGVADYVWNAVDSMTSGGISIVLMLANPRTRSSRFHHARELPNVKSFRISCIDHPNVRQAREVIPGAVRREYVEQMIAGHCITVDQPDDGQHTFSVPWLPDVIYRPDPEFLFRVLGIAPLNSGENILVPVGLYEAAKARSAPAHDPTKARVGVDCARFGNDVGTIYVRHAGSVWREARMTRLDTLDYSQRVVQLAGRLKAKGVTSLHVRIDGGGGFGGGLVDSLKHNLELAASFHDFRVLEVHFGGSPTNGEAYADLVTQMYGDVAEALTGLRIQSPPNELEADLCERFYRWMTHKGVAVKQLEVKDVFRTRHQRSPDDGDGFALAVAADHTFQYRPFSDASWQHGDTPSEEDD